MKAINTGMCVAWARAAGMLYPKEKQLYEDPYSEKLLTPLWKFWIVLMRSPKIFDFIMKSKEKSSPGIMGWLFCRFRYIDDVLKDSIKKKDIKEVVNLGSGMDCRAYNIPGVESIRYFEVDHLSVIEQKKAKMKKIFGQLPNHVVYVPVDFEKQILDTELEKAGYDLTSKTLFIMEGVTQYISKEANDKTFKYVARAAPGSKIVFSYVLKSFIDGKHLHDGVKSLYKYMRKKNNPLWIYGLNSKDLGNYLSKYSLSLIKDVGSKELDERYAKPVNLDSQVSAFNIERIAFAKVIKNKKEEKNEIERSFLPVR